MEEAKLHSRVGIASFVIGLITFLVNLALIAIMLIAFSERGMGYGALKYSEIGQALSDYWSLVATTDCIAVISNLIGICLGVIGLLQRECRRVFAVLGVILNLLATVIALCFEFQYSLDFELIIL